VAASTDMPDFDQNLLRGVSLVLLIIAFLGLWAWAWSDKRKEEFQKMSQLPLEEDRGIVPETGDVATAGTGTEAAAGTKE
jgi:cytochrome c oxidase cbb3-type subunit 4